MERKLANTVISVSLLCCSSVYLRMFRIPENTLANVASRPPYGVISPPKFKVCFRCSSLSFHLVLHRATFEFYIQHCCLRCDIGVSQWDMGVLTSNIQVLTFNIQVSSFNIQVLNWTSRMNVDLLKRIHWVLGARSHASVTQDTSIAPRQHVYNGFKCYKRKINASSCSRTATYTCK